MIPTYEAGSAGSKTEKEEKESVCGGKIFKGNGEVAKECGRKHEQHSIEEYSLGIVRHLVGMGIDFLQHD